MQTTVSSLRNAVDAKLALRLYQRFESLNAPRFIARRLRLPCIAFAVTSVRRWRDEDQQSTFTFEVKAIGLHDFLVTTEDKQIDLKIDHNPQSHVPHDFFNCKWYDGDSLCGLTVDADRFMEHMITYHFKSPARADNRLDCQWEGCHRTSPFRRDTIVRHIREVHLRTCRSKPLAIAQRPSQQSFLLVRPWDPSLLQLPYCHHLSEEDLSQPVSLVHDLLVESLGENGSGSYLRALELVVRLGQPFSGLLLAQHSGGEYKRIAADRNIIAQVKDLTAVRDIRIVEII